MCTGILLGLKGTDRCTGHCFENKDEILRIEKETCVMNISIRLNAENKTDLRHISAQTELEQVKSTCTNNFKSLLGRSLLKLSCL